MLKKRIGSEKCSKLHQHQKRRWRQEFRSQTKLRRGPLGIKTTLISAHLAVDPGEEEALSKLGAQSGALFHMQDFLEGVKADAEGRKPVYQGR